MGHNFETELEALNYIADVLDSVLGKLSDISEQLKDVERALGQTPGIE